jgi:hypothetical protein
MLFFCINLLLNFFPNINYTMKLKGVHLFIILLLALVFASSLGSIVEGMSNNRPKKKSTVQKQNSNNLSSRSYDPQSNISGSNYYDNVDGDGDVDSSLSKMVSLDNGQSVYATPQNTIEGIPRHQIPSGQEDLYILKSQVVPPVCPACPTIINNCDKNKKCAPCPPCGRCPESAFECVKRPTYQPENPYLPMPVLADFSQFGM